MKELRECAIDADALTPPAEPLPPEPAPRAAADDAPPRPTADIKADLATRVAAAEAVLAKTAEAAAMEKKAGPPDSVYPAVRPPPKIILNPPPRETLPPLPDHVPPEVRGPLEPFVSDQEVAERKVRGRLIKQTVLKKKAQRHAGAKTTAAPPDGDEFPSALEFQEMQPITAETPPAEKAPAGEQTGLQALAELSANVEESGSIHGLQSSIEEQKGRLQGLLERVETLRMLATSLEESSVRRPSSPAVLCHYPSAEPCPRARFATPPSGFPSADSVTTQSVRPCRRPTTRTTPTR